MSNALFDAIRARLPEPQTRLLETDEGRILTYADMLVQSARLANALVTLGVEPGDRVAVQVEKSVEAILLYLATIRAGAIFLPLNTAYTVTELDYFLADAEPRLVVVDPHRSEVVRAVASKAGARLETLGASRDGSLTTLAATLPDSFADRPRQADDLAAILYTSGTTGRSKGAMLSQANLASNAEVLVKTWHFTGDDVLIHALPIFHTHGLFVATNVVLFAGASMILQSKFDPERIVDALPRGTTLMGVPTFYVRLLQHPGLTRESTAGMRLFISGSAPLLAETHAAWRARTGHAILERYGMTETNMNTSNPYEGERRAGTVGFPLKGTELRVTDPESGRDLPRGEIGIIEVRGPNVFKGYWRMPEKTKAEFRPDGFFITGDLGRIDDDGYVHIVGRGKDLIISGGFNIYPKEIEAEIDALDGVVESAVIGVPHPDMGEAVVAVVVPRPGSTLTQETVLAAVGPRLARFKHPRHVAFVDDLPRNTMGKVQKNTLRETFWRIFAAPA